MGLIQTFQNAGQHVFGRVAPSIQATTNFIKQVPKAARDTFLAAARPAVMASALTFGGATTGLFEETITNTPNQAQGEIILSFDGILDLQDSSTDPFANQFDGTSFTGSFTIDTNATNISTNPSIAFIPNAAQVSIQLPNLATPFTGFGNIIIGNSNNTESITIDIDTLTGSPSVQSILFQSANNFGSSQNALGDTDLNDAISALQGNQFDIGALTLSAADFDLMSSFNQLDSNAPQTLNISPATSVAAVPEPSSTIFLLGTMAGGAAVFARRKRKQAKNGADKTSPSLS